MEVGYGFRAESGQPGASEPWETVKAERGDERAGRGVRG